MEGRITYKKLVDWVNLQFEKLEITEYEAISAERTYHRSDYYEAGACKLLIKVKTKNAKEGTFNSEFYFMCFYFLWEYQQALSNGYEMYLTFNEERFRLMKNLEIRLRKAGTKQINTK